MKKPINEIKKMQRLAGLITESEYQKSLIKESSTLTIRVALDDDYKKELELVNQLEKVIDIDEIGSAQDGDMREISYEVNGVINNQVKKQVQNIINAFGQKYNMEVEPVVFGEMDDE